MPRRNKQSRHYHLKTGLAYGGRHKPEKPQPHREHPVQLEQEGGETA